jgi:hypothetical protein
MKRGYLPNNLTLVPEYEVFMLPGLSAEFDACRLAGLTISRIEFHEFQILEEPQFVKDLEDVFFYNRVPYYCIFSSYDANNELLPERSRLRAEAVHRLARALWLLKEGVLYDPLLCVSYRRVGM